MKTLLSIAALAILTACGDGTNLPVAIVAPVLPVAVVAPVLPVAVVAPVQPAPVVSAQADVATQE
jgi:hypothetical protein